MTEVQVQERVSVMLERELWVPTRIWNRGAEHLAKRYARAVETPLPLQRTRLDEELTPGDEAAAAVAEAVAVLDEWSAGAIDWEREMERFLDEHLPLYRPEYKHISRSLRSLGSFELVSSVPEAPLGALARHLGLGRAACLRSLHPSGVSPGK